MRGSVGGPLPADRSPVPPRGRQAPEHDRSVAWGDGPAYAGLSDLLVSLHRDSYHLQGLDDHDRDLRASLELNMLIEDSYSALNWNEMAHDDFPYWNDWRSDSTNDGSSAGDFLKMVWVPYASDKCLTQRDMRAADPRGFTAVSRWCKASGVKLRSFLPKSCFDFDEAARRHGTEVRWRDSVGEARRGKSTDPAVREKVGLYYRGLRTARLAKTVPD